MIHEVGDLPTSYDARDEYKSCKSLTHVLDQGPCGSCWANASASAMSDRICIHSNQKKQTYVSPANLMQCCHICGQGCDGGFMYQAFIYWDTVGIVSGGDYGDDEETCQPYPFPSLPH